MGASALAKCSMLLQILEQVTAETGRADVKLVVQEIASLGLSSWSEDTVTRYASVGRKLIGANRGEVTSWLKKSEYIHGDNAAFYNITALRALASPSLREGGRPVAFN